MRNVVRCVTAAIGLDGGSLLALIRILPHHLCTGWHSSSNKRCRIPTRASIIVHVSVRTTSQDATGKADQMSVTGLREEPGCEKETVTHTVLQNAPSRVEFNNAQIKFITTDTIDQNGQRLPRTGRTEARNSCSIARQAKDVQRRANCGPILRSVTLLLLLPGPLPP